VQELPRTLRWYLILLNVVCLALLLYEVVLWVYAGVPGRLDRSMIASLAVFVAISYVAEHTRLQIKGEVWQNLATGTCIGALLLFPPPYPMLITLVAALVSQIRQHNTWVKRAYNIVHPMLSVGLTGLLCAMVFDPSTLLQRGFLPALPALALLIGLYHLFDIGMMLGLFALLGNEPPWQVWRQTYRHTLLPELAVATVGILIAIVWRYDPPALSLLALPLVALLAAFRANARAEKQAAALRLRGTQLETVLTVGQHLRLQQSRAALLQAVAEAAHTITQAKTVTGYLRDEEDTSRLRRIVVAPHEAPDPGPAYLSVENYATPLAGDELRVPIGPEETGVAGLLLLAGVPETIGVADKDVLAVLATQAAIALQNAQLHERALALAAQDSLTNLLNRRVFQSRLEEEIARATRGGHALCLLMIDLDNFGEINNTYGHQAGDMTLRMIAQVISANIRVIDVPGRYGGDEFVVLLPETSLEQAMHMAERLGAVIAALMVIEGPLSISTTASIGVAAMPDHGRAPEDLLRAADQAAYAAKHGGKGRVSRPEDAALALDRDPVLLAAQLAHANMATVAALASAVDAKDPYTQGHSQRVSRYAAALATAMLLPATQVARIQLAGQLHDVGKIGVPDAILTKTGRLSLEEFDAIRQHPAVGERMLADVPFLKDILPAVRHHHERWDGRGYPDGLRGAEIPQEAAIIAVADAFDAMTSSRTYRSALPLAEARRRIVEGSGSQFDPRVVRAFEQAVAAGDIALHALPCSEVLLDTVDLKQHSLGHLTHEPLATSA
jgi:diguanylate cyclase (GGDEF)-like protein